MNEMKIKLQLQWIYGGHCNSCNEDWYTNDGICPECKTLLTELVRGSIGK